MGNGTVPLRTRNGIAGQAAPAASIPSAPMQGVGRSGDNRAGELASMRKQRVSLQRQLNQMHAKGDRGAAARSIMGNIQKKTNEYNTAQGGPKVKGRQRSQTPQPAAPRAAGAAPAPGRVQPTSAPQAGPQGGPQGGDQMLPLSLIHI